MSQSKEVREALKVIASNLLIDGAQNMERAEKLNPVFLWERMTSAARQIKALIEQPAEQEPSGDAVAFRWETQVGDRKVWNYAGFFDCTRPEDAEPLYTNANHAALVAIHEVVMCIGCVTEVDKSASLTVRGVQQMALRIQGYAQRNCELENALGACVDVCKNEARKQVTAFTAWQMVKKIADRVTSNHKAKEQP